MISDIVSLEDVQELGILFQILVAILVILIGWLISGAIGQLIIALLEKLRLNKALKRMGWEEAFEKADISLNASKFFGEIVKWIFVIVSFLVASEVLGLTEFSRYLGDILDYFRHIIVACLIFIVAVFLSDFSHRIVVASAQKAKIAYSKILGIGIRWAVWIFAILAILLELQVAETIITAMVYGLVATTTLAFGLAFGLGGREFATEILKDFKDKIS